MIAVGTPAAGASTIIAPTSHHRQRSRASFKINGEKGRLSMETCRRPKEQDEQFNTSLFILLRQNRSGRSGPTIEIVRDGLGVSTSLPPGPCDTLSIASGDQSHTSTTVNQLVRQDGEKGQWVLQEKNEASLPLVKQWDSVQGMPIR
jgi:hypothetical protein